MRFLVFVILAFALAGCVASGDFPFRYASWSNGDLRQGDLQGQTYAFDSLGLASQIEAGEKERAAGLEEIEAHLLGYGLTRVDDIESADLIFKVFVGYEPDEIKQRNPIYAGGGRERVEIEREVPQYDQQGRYRGTRRVREVEYHTRPAVLTGYKDTVEETEQPVVILMAFSAENYRPDGDYGTLVANDMPHFFFGVGLSEIYPTTFAQTGHCLVQEMLRNFPATHSRRTHNVPSHFDCAVFTDHPELQAAHGIAAP